MNSLYDALNPYKIFISHSWSYSESYDSLIRLLNNRPGFLYKNLSIPKENPIHYAKNEAELYQAIKARIDQSEVVLILAGVYSTHSKWINLEIKAARSNYGSLLTQLTGTSNKPIIAVEEWASRRTSKIVKDNAHEIVKWNSDSIIDAIKRRAVRW